MRGLKGQWAEKLESQVRRRQPWGAEANGFLKKKKTQEKKDSISQEACIFFLKYEEIYGKGSSQWNCSVIGAQDWRQTRLPLILAPLEFAVQT